MDPRVCLSTIDDLFRALAKCASGRRLLKAFQPRLDAREVAFRPYPDSLRTELVAALEPGQPLGAAVVWEENFAILYYDASAPLGLLVPMIAHEMSHCLDRSLIQAIQRNPSAQGQRERYLFATERRAFDWQFEIQAEMETLWPDLTLFLKKNYAHVWMLRKRPSDSEICEHYGFNQNTVIAA